VLDSFNIALVLARTGRAMAAVRDIEISTIETALGWPMACAQAGDTSVFIHQAPAGAGLLIEITTKTAVEHDALIITLDGRSLHPALPPGGHGDRDWPGGQMRRLRPPPHGRLGGHWTPSRRGRPPSYTAVAGPDGLSPPIRNGHPDSPISAPHIRMRYGYAALLTCEPFCQKAYG
jgi:hypothetical protein